MMRHTFTALTVFALVALFGGKQAQATGKYNPPKQPQQKDCDIELPKCYWTAKFKVEYKGTYYYGKIFYTDENVKKSGTSKIAVNPSSSLGTKSGLLGIEFNFKGKTFKQCDDIDFSKYPIAKFVNGKFAGLDFAVKYSGDKFHVNYDKFEKNGKKQSYVKYYDGEYNCDDCEIVPTPAAASAGFALLGTLAFRRRRAA